MPNWPISDWPPPCRRPRAASFVEKGAGARTGDGAERLDEVVAAHADAVVGEGQRLFVRIDARCVIAKGPPSSISSGLAIAS